MLFIAAAGCAAYIWFFEFRPPFPGPSGPDAGVLPAFDPERVERLRLAIEGRTIEMAREGDEWFLTDPFKARTDASIVQRALDVLGHLPQKEAITPSEMRIRGLTPASYGLDEPRAVVTLVLGTETIALRVGIESPLGDSRYVQGENEPDIVATTPEISSVLNKDPASWRDKRLVRGEPGATTRFEIKVLGRPGILLACEGNAWKMQKPLEINADAAIVAGLLSVLFAAEALYFPSEAMADPVVYGFGEDEMPLQLGIWRPRDQAGMFLRFGKKVPDMAELVYANIKGMNSVMAVDRNLIAVFDVKPADLRDKLVLAFDPASVKRVEITRGGTSHSAERDSAGAWQSLRPELGAADATAINEIVSRFARVEAIRFVSEHDPAQSGLETGSVRLALDFEGGGAGEILILGDPAPEGDSVYASMQGRNGVFLLNADMAAMLRAIDILH